MFVCPSVRALVHINFTSKFKYVIYICLSMFPVENGVFMNNGSITGTHKNFRMRCLSAEMIYSVI